MIPDDAFAGEASASPADADDADGEDDLDGYYRLGSVSPTLISVMLFAYDYPHGTPHGMFSQKGVAWLLREDRALRAEDLFDRSRSWAPALARLVFATAKRKDGDSIPPGVSRPGSNRWWPIPITG